jgi:hypothetical protein
VRSPAVKDFRLAGQSSNKLRDRRYLFLAADIRRQKGLDLVPLIVAQPKQVASHVLCSLTAENH